MDFRLTDGQLALRDEVRVWLGGVMTPEMEAFPYSEEEDPPRPGRTRFTKPRRCQILSHHEA